MGLSATGLYARDAAVPCLRKWQWWSPGSQERPQIQETWGRGWGTSWSRRPGSLGAYPAALVGAWRHMGALEVGHLKSKSVAGAVDLRWPQQHLAEPASRAAAPSSAGGASGCAWPEHSHGSGDGSPRTWPLPQSNSAETRCVSSQALFSRLPSRAPPPWSTSSAKRAWLPVSEVVTLERRLALSDAQRECWLGLRGSEELFLEKI